MTFEGEDVRPPASALDAALLPWVERIGPEHLGPFRLEQRDGALYLDAPDRADGSLRIDLTRGSSGYRGARARSERLVRACGIGDHARVIDATGGLGTDAWLLARAGATVHVLERHPVVAALLADGLRRAALTDPKTAARITLTCGDSRSSLAETTPAGAVVYLDPMYPPRRKTALGDRRLRLLAALFAATGEGGDDVAGLFAAALATAATRIVLKRPQRVALPEGVVAPGYSLTGRSTRFDVWRR